MMEPPRSKAALPVMLFAVALMPFETLAQTHAEFSGSWLRVSQSCHAKNLTGGSYEMLVTQHDPMLEVTIISTQGASSRKLALSYKTAGDEIHYTGLDGDDFRSRAEWSGPRLVFKTTELERGKQIRSEELWTLTPEAAKLTVVRSKDGEKEHASCTSTFVRKR